MNKLLYIKPIKIFLMHIAAIAISIGIFISWTELVPDSIKPIGFTFVILGIIGGYQFWIYLLFKGFDTIDSQNGIKSNLRKSKLHLQAILVAYVLVVLILNLDYDKVDYFLPQLINFLLGITLMFSFFYVARELTKKFKFYENKPDPNLWDYFVTLFTLTFYPFGIIMMHSHLQLILKDQRIGN